MAYWNRQKQTFWALEQQNRRRSRASSGGGATQSLREQVIAALGADIQTFQTSDLTNLFTTSTGVTQAALNDPVGLRLDLKDGLELGPELVTNGDGTNTTGWTAGGGIKSFNSVDGEFRLVANGGVFAQIDQTGIGAENKWYKFSITLRSPSTNSVSNVGLVRVTVGASTTMVQVSSEDENVNLSTIVRTGAGQSVSLNIRMSNGVSWAADDDVLFVDNISAKELPGNHARQSNAGLRPAVTGDPTRITYDGVDDELVTTFPSSLGSSCTVARSIPSTGASILTAQTIGTSFTDDVSNHALLIVDRALTGEETTLVTAMLNAEAGL